MRTIALGKNKVEIFESIDELPIKRFHRFNKFMLVDSGIGSDLNDINAHIARIGQFIKTDPVHATEELENLRQLLYLISEEISPKYLAFGAMVHSINGRHRYDLSDEGIKETIKILNDTPRGLLDRLIESVKKKIDEELSLYFSKIFDDTSSKEFYGEMASRTLLQLDEIIRGNDHKLEIDEIDTRLMTKAKPQNFAGKNGVEVQFDKQFEEMCLYISQSLSVDAEKLTVSQYYSSTEYIKKLNKFKTNGRK